MEGFTLKVFASIKFKMADFLLLFILIGLIFGKLCQTHRQLL